MLEVVCQKIEKGVFVVVGGVVCNGCDMVQIAFFSLSLPVTHLLGSTTHNRISCHSFAI